jgi:3-deoxy-manno-octulosonate cytidylyltransferase (CMP-KDO synthetase)
MSSAIVVIPARYASTRLPAKPLADIRGKPMIQWVYERSRRSKGVDRVVVATDDERIVQAVESFGGEALMTSSEIQSGTDRVAAVADVLPADIYVNVQGDEPLIDPLAIEKAIQILKNSEYSMSTIMTPLRTLEELRDPSVVKVLADRNGRAIYFSRHPIPYSRGPIPETGDAFGCWRHVGLYGYRRETLMQFRGLPPSSLEKGEILEQLRALDHGIPIGIAEVCFTSIGVDTPEDLEKVRQYLV